MSKPPPRVGQTINPVEIIGVKEMLVGGFYEKTVYNTVFQCSPWRLAGGSIEESVLTLFLPGSRENFKTLARVDRHAVLKFRGVFRNRKSNKHRSITVVEFCGVTADDPELHARAMILREADRFVDPTFESLRLGSPDIFHGRATWLGKRIRTLFFASRAELPEMLTKAKKVWCNQPDWDRRARAFAAKRICIPKNQNVLKFPELSPEDFAARLDLRVIVFNPKSFNLLYSARNLARKNSILLSASFKTGKFNKGGFQ